MTELPGEATATLVMVKVADVVPTGMVTVAGTVATLTLLLVTATLKLAGALPLIVSVPTALDVELPLMTVGGAMAIAVTTGALTSSVADLMALPAALPAAALMVTVPLVGTGTVVTGNVPVAAPAVMTSVAGTVATAVSVLVRFSVRPPVGALPARVTVAVGIAPPVTEEALRASDEIIGCTVRTALAVWLPTNALIVTGVVVATTKPRTLNVALTAPAGTVTVVIAEPARRRRIGSRRRRIVGRDRDRQAARRGGAVQRDRRGRIGDAAAAHNGDGRDSQTGNRRRRDRQRGRAGDARKRRRDGRVGDCGNRQGGNRERRRGCAGRDGDAGPDRNRRVIARKGDRLGRRRRLVQRDGADRRRSGTAAQLRNADGNGSEQWRDKHLCRARKRRLRSP